LPAVVFAGFVQAREIASYYALADVMVFPTLGDPHGLVVEEAMIAGLPVISSSAAGDIARRLPDGEAGYVVPPADPDALSQRMRALADDCSRRLRMGKRAAELASSRGHTRYAEDFEAFIAGTLARPARTTWAAAGARTVGALLSRTARGHSPAPLVSVGRPPDR
jgi:glycosyltransferase involved in cell wall biosynthesis